MKRSTACDPVQYKEKPLVGHAWRPIMRACVTVKRLPWTSTKPSRYVAKVGTRGKTYGLGVIPTHLENDADQAKWVAERFLHDKNLAWTFIQHATMVGDTFVFIAK